MRLIVFLLVALITLGSSAQNCGDYDCHGHGDCVNGQCNCEEGWSGAQCDVYLCGVHVDGCTGHGQCRESGCVCHDGFGGYNCAGVTTNCPNFCKGHGSCLDGVCTCDKGYKGEDCGRVDPSYGCVSNCSGHGFCDVSGASPSCICMPSFWSGEACNVESSLCPVELNGCSGHGICEPTSLLDSSSPWVCKCEVGFCGTSCNRVCPQCLNNCTGHGVCSGTVCTCDAGFSGEDCSLVVAIAECTNNCSGHGHCQQVSGQYQCVCEPNYSGASCSLSGGLCPGNCSAKGECMPDGTCSCFSGYQGVACETALGNCEAHNNCSANGVCKNGICQCFPGFSGLDCSIACHTGGIADIGCNADKGHGICVNGTCVCKEGEWAGVGCETRVHGSSAEAIVSTSFPVGVIVVCIVGAALVLLLIGGVYNYVKKGKKWLQAVPGYDVVRTTVKPDGYVQAPSAPESDGRYTSNF